MTRQDDGGLALYRWLALARALERALCAHNPRWFPAEGEEATIVGSFCDLRPDDVAAPHYRGPFVVYAMRGAGLWRLCAQAFGKADGYNPLCGDKLKLYLRVEGDVVRDLSFVGSGCAISTASASLMTEALKGKKVADVEHFFQDFQHMVTGADASPQPQLGKLEVLAGVREFPSRVKCATLAWHTLLAALKGERRPVSTE